MQIENVERNELTKFSVTVSCHLIEPQCGVALVTDEQSVVERASPSCPPASVGDPPAERGGGDSETESDADDL